MPSMDSIVAMLDGLMPGRHSLTVALVGSVAVVGAILVWLSRVLLLWRKDQRETAESIAVLMGHLVDQQGQELKRMGADADVLRRQITQFVEGRWQIQRALDDMRDQVIAARVMIHDYERRLGLPETSFPILPVLAVIPSPT